jgi:hypothetical protein
MFYPFPQDAASVEVEQRAAISQAADREHVLKVA